MDTLLDFDCLICDHHISNISLIMICLEIVKFKPFLQSIMMIMMTSFDSKEQWRRYVRENVVNEDMQGSEGIREKQ